MEQVTRDENRTQAVVSSLSQSGLPTIVPGSFDIAHECDIMLAIKGKCVHALEALRSNLWL